MPEAFEMGGDSRIENVKYFKCDTKEQKTCPCSFVEVLLAPS
jgi:hypothetical protein